ncbi:MAG TPA: hypothetical protein PLI61_06935, partial [bacterium]|nr:hypothetical protein [bacterium]
VDFYSSYETLGDIAVPDNDSIRYNTFNDLGVALDPGETLYIRFFGYNSEAAAGTWRIQADSLKIGGYFVAVP